MNQAAVPRMTEPQKTLLRKFLASPNGEVLPYGGEWSAAYKLARLGLIAIVREYRHGQVYFITDAGRAALASLSPPVTP